MRFRALLIALLTLVALTLSTCGAGGGSRHARLQVRPTGPYATVHGGRLRVKLIVKPAGSASSYDATLSWTIPAFPATTGYYTFQDGVQVGSPAGSPYVFQSLACGTTYTLGVQAHNGSGGTGQIYSTSYATPACASPALQPQGPVASLHPGGGSWGIAFDDEFSGSSLDTSHWTVGWFGTGITKAPNSSDQYCADPANVSVSGGNLNLLLTTHTETCNGTAQPYTGSLIYSNGTCGCGSGAGSFAYTYGVAEARVFFPASSGTTPANWPIWWEVGQVWPTNGEIDIAESLGGCIAYHFHYSGGGPGGCAAGGWGGAWHTFQAYWEPGVINWYYDGTLIGTQSTGVTSAPMYLVLENGQGTFGGSTLTPATLLVDYVRVWQ